MSGRWLERLEHAAAAKRDVRGVRVVVMSFTEPVERRAEEPYFRKIEEALALIERWAPHRMRELKRDLARITVRRTPGTRAHQEADGTCVLDTIFVTELSSAEIASSIIHESIHAKVRRKGWRLPRAREEKLCRRAEMRFGVHVPDVPIVHARARADYEHYRTTDEYDIDLRKAYRESRERLMKEHIERLPRWLKPIVEALARRRMNRTESENS